MKQDKSVEARDIQVSSIDFLSPKRKIVYGPLTSVDVSGPLVKNREFEGLNSGAAIY